MAKKSVFSYCVFNICDSSSSYWSEERKDFVGLAVIGKQVAEQSCKILIDSFLSFLQDQLTGKHVFCETSLNWLGNRFFAESCKISRGDQLIGDEHSVGPVTKFHLIFHLQWPS